MPPKVSPRELGLANRPWSSRLFRLMRNPLLSRLAAIVNRPFPRGREILVNVHGSLMAARSWDRALALLLWKWSWLEAAESAALRAQAREGMLAVDIGANIGFHTLQLSRWAGPKGRVYAFEPDPHNFELLVKNVEANGCRNVVCLRKAVADKTGEAALFLSPYNRGDHRLQGSSLGQASIRVEAVALDDLLSSEPRVDLVKMDIQGAEYRALLGMERLLRRSPGAALISELSPELLESAGDSAEAFLRKAEELGLEPSLLRRRGGQAPILPAAEIADLLRCRKGIEIGLLLRSRGGPVRPDPATSSPG